MLGAAKNLGTTPDYVLNEMSYQNLMLYSAALPMYDDVNDEPDFNEAVDANNPENFKNDEEETIVRI